MKKIRSIIIIISVVLCVAVAAVAGVYLIKDKDVSVPEPDRATKDAYLLSGEKDKAPERVNAVWITDGTDGSFVADDEAFRDSLQIAKQSLFSEICIDVPEKNCADQKERGEKMAFAVSEVSSLGKKAYIGLSATEDISALTEYIGEADGFIIKADKCTADELNLAASSLKEAVKDKKLIASRFLNIQLFVS